MSYLVLARKYRPRTFEEVVDQDHVTRTLANAISSDRVAHAILFSGPRGTGKTTVARILAKAMNCADGPTAIPCNACRSCKEITSGSAVDVFEIDGASNNSVDQVRELRDNVKYMPAHSLYKVYIIDEVHMLSTPAFNALLKTLEEPPAHVLFMFATTEPHKIPMTILSRCQRHDFKRIKLESIVSHMQFINEQEGFEISPESLAIIAREAGGSMRDGLSLLDQVMACSENSVSDTQVLDLLGVVDRRVYYDVSAALFDENVVLLLEIFENLYDRGHDMKRFYFDLVAHFRNLLVAKLGHKTGQLVDLPENEIRHLQDQVDGKSAAYLNQVFDLLFKEEPTVKFSTQPKIALEMIFFKMLQVKPALPIDVLIDKLDVLRKEFARGNLAAVSSVRSAGDDSPPVQEPAISNGSSAQRSDAAQQRPESRLPVSDNPVVPPPGADRDINSTWQLIQQTISKDHPALAASLVKCNLKQAGPDHLIVQVTGNSFNFNMIRRGRNPDIIHQVCRDIFTREMKVDIVAAETDAGNTPKKNKANRLKSEALSHPLVTDAIDIFEGKLIDVKLTKEEDS